MGEQLVANGIDPRTGEPLVTIDEAELAGLVAALESVDDPADTLGTTQRGALPWNVEPTSIAGAGWSIVFARDEDTEVRDALAPLVLHRETQTDGGNHHVHDYVLNEDVIGWLARYGATPGIIDPSRVGYYVLLVGAPTKIPFDLQYLLDVEYAVGRIHFDTPAEYRRYAESVVASERGDIAPRDKTTAFWGPRHSWDRATNLSADHLLTPLVDGADGRPGVATTQGFQSAGFIGDTATRDCLLEILAGEANGVGRPGLIVTASHGLGLPDGDPGQRVQNGALVTQDWARGPVGAGAVLSGDDVADARVAGMMAFVFACYGAGTPAFDDFPRLMSNPPMQIAPEPFIAHLPKALLAHPEGSALAVIGHVERAWGYSIVSAGGSQLRRFEDVLGQLLAGRPVGHAMKVFNDAYAVLTASLAQRLRVHAQHGGSASQLLNLWMERTDAQNYVVLGDPAATLRT